MLSAKKNDKKFISKCKSISIYIHGSLKFKSRRDLDINVESINDSINVESLSIELISKNSKNTVLSTIYSRPDGGFKAFNTFLKGIYSISLKSNKFFYVTRYFSLKDIDHNKYENVTKFLNLTFEYGLVPVIYKPTRVTKNTATVIDHIITNSSYLDHIILLLGQ